MSKESEKCVWCGDDSLNITIIGLGHIYRIFFFIHLDHVLLPWPTYVQQTITIPRRQWRWRRSIQTQKKSNNKLPSLAAFVFHYNNDNKARAFNRIPSAWINIFNLIVWCIYANKQKKKKSHDNRRLWPADSRTQNYAFSCQNDEEFCSLLNKCVNRDAINRSFCCLIVLCGRPTHYNTDRGSVKDQHSS